LPLSELTGRGTGLNDQQLAHKLAILQKAQALHGQVKTP
jgi:nicotinate-nucleotide--dimethylbenzimidazole phosphoribosyltransferase